MSARAWVSLALLAGLAVMWLGISQSPTFGQTAPNVSRPGVSIDIELKRDRRRSPKFLKIKKRKLVPSRLVVITSRGGEHV